jgi:sugar phosphate isomerase/epimerase
VLLGYNTNGLQNHRLGDALRLLADHGYRAVAITPDTCHLDPFRTTARHVARLAGLLDRLQLRPVMETGARFLLDPSHKHEPTLMSRDSAARQRRLDLYARVAAIGHELGAGVVSFWSGIDRQPGQDSEAWLLDGVRRTCELVRRHGLRPALEPEPGMAVATLHQFRSVQAALGDHAPDLTLDIGHLYVEWEGDPAGLIATLGPELVQVHLEDMQRGEHEHLPPGEGEVDFSGIHKALRQQGYSGPVCFELSRSSHRAPEVVALCQRTWAEINGN